MLARSPIGTDPYNSRLNGEWIYQGCYDNKPYYVNINRISTNNAENIISMLYLYYQSTKNRYCIYSTNGAQSPLEFLVYPNACLAICNYNLTQCEQTPTNWHILFSYLPQTSYFTNNNTMFVGNCNNVTCKRGSQSIVNTLCISGGTGCLLCFFAKKKYAISQFVCVCVACVYVQQKKQFDRQNLET